jgi:hypothetical protein
VEVGHVDKVLEELWCQNPEDGPALIMKHCKNNINLYHHKNIISQKVIIIVE